MPFFPKQPMHQTPQEYVQARDSGIQLWWMNARVLPSRVSHRSQAETFSSPEYYIVMAAFIINLNLAVTPQPPISQTTAGVLSHACPHPLNSSGGCRVPSSSHCKGVPRRRTSAYTCRLFNWDGREISSIFKQFAVGNLKTIFLRSRWEDTFPHNRTQIIISRCTAVSTLATDLSFPLSICFEGKVPDYHEENTMYGWPLFQMIVFPYYLTGLFFKTHLPYCCLLYYGSPLKFCQCG